MIVKVNKEDIETLVEISKKTFWDTFAKDNVEEDIVKYIEDNLNSEVLLSELNNSNSHFAFAKEGSEVLGVMKLNINDAQSEDISGNGYELERIYVMKQGQGKGIGQSLMNYAIKFGKDQDFDFLWLGVWEHNYKAIEFYKKNNYIEFSKHTFMMGEDEQTDLLFKLNLK